MIKLINKIINYVQYIYFFLTLNSQRIISLLCVFIDTLGFCIVITIGMDYDATIKIFFIVFVTTMLPILLLSNILLLFISKFINWLYKPISDIFLINRLTKNISMNTNIKVDMNECNSIEYIKDNVKEAISNCSKYKKVTLNTHGIIFREINKLKKNGKIQVEESKSKFMFINKIKSKLKKRMYREKLALYGCTFEEFLKIKSDKKHNFYKVVITIN